MRIINTRQSLANLIVALVVLFLFGLAEGAVAVFAAKTFSLDDWATGWIGGFISAGVLSWLIRDNKKGS